MIVEYDPQFEPMPRSTGFRQLTDKASVTIAIGRNTIADEEWNSIAKEPTIASRIANGSLKIIEPPKVAKPAAKAE